MSDDPRERENAAAQADLAEIVAMLLIEKRVIDRDDLCTELEGLASARRSEGHAAVAAGLVRLAVSLRAMRHA